MNYKNKLSSHLIILIYTLGDTELNLNIEYYSRGFIHHVFNSNIHKYCNTTENIKMDLLEKKLDNLENTLKIITNKFNVEKNIFKLYYTINYPLKICYTKITNYYKSTM
ncbi:plasmid maintenance protein [Borreliella burgdorferi]